MTGMRGPAGRWERLALDLEAQAEAWAAAERAGEVAERQRLESGAVRLIDRLRSAPPGPVVLHCAGGLRIRGRLARLVGDALVVAEDGGREALVAVPAVLAVTGAGGSRVEPARDGAESRIGFRHLARGVARDRSVVRVHLVDGSVLDGTLDRIGADVVELAIHPAGEARRRGAVRESALVALAAIVAVRRDADFDGGGANG